MKMNELNALSLEDLGHQVSDLREELFNLRFQHATGQLDNPMRLGQVRKDIARALTVLRQKEAQGL